MLIQMPKLLVAFLPIQALKEKILVVLVDLSPLLKPSNPPHSLGDMHEIDYRNHQAFQA